MRDFIRIGWVAFALAYADLQSHAQAPTPAESPAEDFFSGTVVKFDPAQITVFRKGVGKDTTATRTFLIDHSTKVEGEISVKARVTVRFTVSDGTATAVHIIAR